MPEEHNVRIVTWPDGPARLEHRFELEKPCPVSIHFTEAPARVEVSTSPRRPLDVNMNMALTAREVIPVCLKVCEPICARSDYTVGIDVFDRPVASISVRGETRLFNCEEKPIPKETCVGFEEFKDQLVFPAPVLHQGLVLSPLGDPLFTGDLGDPPGRMKLRFPPSGIRIELPGPSSDVRLVVNCYNDPLLEFAVFSGTTLVNQFDETVENEVRSVSIPNFGVTAVEVRGGGNEASLVEVCYQIIT